LTAVIAAIQPMSIRVGWAGEAVVTP